MIPILEVAIAAIAAIISILSLKTQRTIKHLDVGKSFWIPVALSGLLFITGSAITILNQTNFSSATIIPMTDEIAQITRLIALGILLTALASYSRQVSRNLSRARETETETPTEEARPLPAAELPIQERLDQPEFKVQAPQVCRHEFGYLRTLPRNESIPDECLRCNKILDCRHGLSTTVKTQTQPTPQGF